MRGEKTGETSVQGVVSSFGGGEGGGLLLLWLKNWLEKGLGWGGWRRSVMHSEEFTATVCLLGLK